MRGTGWWVLVVLLAIPAACGSDGVDGHGGSSGIAGGGSGGTGGEGGSGGSGPTHGVIATPASLDFHWVCAGGSGRESLIVANRGGAPVEATIEAAAPLLVEPGSVRLDPLAEAPVGVQVAPPAGTPAGRISGVIAVRGQSGEVSVPWTASVTQEPRGRPTALCGSEIPCVLLDTGTAAVGDEVETAFDVTNDGCGAFTVTALLPRGPGGISAPELRVIEPAVPFLLAPGERRSIRLAFGPTQTGDMGGDVVVQTNTPSHDEIRLPWAGIGL